MKDILSKIFQRRKIEDVNDLSLEERQTFEQYERVLSKEELTIDDLKGFLKNQIGVIEMKWRDYETKNKSDLIPYHTVYSVLLKAVDAPQVERETLERYLIEQLK